MKITNLTVSNVGVFKGKHSFDLTPTASTQTTARSVTVINGHNGAGKSTLFRAIALALHGPQSSVALLNGQTYEGYSNGLIHRSLVTPSEVPPEASIRLQFEYVRSGTRDVVSVERKWGTSLLGEQETLHVLCNGSLPDIEPGHYQTWINGFISPDVIPLCCFDAEQLDALSSPDRYNKLLGGLVRRLFGFDMVEKLYSDLRLVAMRTGRESDEQNWTDAVLHHQEEVARLKDKVSGYQDDLLALDNQQAELEEALNRQKGRLAAEGGEYAKQRPLTEERLNLVKHDLDQIASELRELSNALLPFALAPDLCRALSTRLYVESEARQKQIAEAVWKKRIALVKSNLHNDDLWKDLGLTTGQRTEVRKRLERLLRQAVDSSDQGQQIAIHHLSEPAHAELQQWLKQATETLPQHSNSLSKRCNQLRLERQNLELQLRRAPDEEILKPMHEEIVKLQTELGKVQERKALVNQELGAIRFRLTEQERLLKKADEEVRLLHIRHRQIGLAEKSKNALRAYQDALTSQRTHELEHELVNAFNTLCSKERLISDVHIDPKNFRLEFHDENRQLVRLDDLSAGERHLYVLALLWALRRVSKLDLPLFIDTPLARLDESHRTRMVHTFLPQVSEQVVLFTTDAEMNNRLLEEAEPYLSRVYRLRFDPQLGETTVI